MAKNNVKSKAVGSIIDHTTTCPYCGHRILHENRTSHIQRQHPDRYESDVLTAKLDKERKPAVCSYCSASMPIAELETHVQKHHLSELKHANAAIREKERAQRAEKRKRRAKMTQEYEAHLAYSTRIDTLVKPIRPRQKDKTKKLSPITPKKTAPKSNKKAQLPPILRKPVDPGTKTFTNIASFRCTDCGREINGQTKEQHQKEDFLLRTKVRWLLTGRNADTTVSCPVCGKQLSPAVLSSHLEEDHSVFYRYAIG